VRRSRGFRPSLGRRSGSYPRQRHHSGYIETPFLDDILGERKEAILTAAASRLPAKRIGRVEEAADGVLFLMKNQYVTGIALLVDGGYHLV
jgi:NAD(P)-dependent dehydrogenase (short-subunit alcohol dehydrogenase family)